MNNFSNIFSKNNFKPDELKSAGNIQPGDIGLKINSGEIYKINLGTAASLNASDVTKPNISSIGGNVIQDQLAIFCDEKGSIGSNINANINIGSLGLGLQYPGLNGLSVLGNVNIGKENLEDDSKVFITAFDSFGININGILSSVGKNSTQAGFICNNTFSPNESCKISAGLISTISFDCNINKNIELACGIYIRNDFDSNEGEIDYVSGIYINSGGRNNGNIKKSYGIYVEQPIHGESKCSAYLGGNNILGLDNTSTLQLNLETSITATAGGMGIVPMTVVEFAVINVNGKNRKIALYNI